MKLLKNGRLADNPWQPVDDGDTVPDAGAIIVSEDFWQRHYNKLIGRAGPVAVAVDPESDMAEILEDLDRIDAVFLPFPAFTDGRSYSRARRLRIEHGYESEIRATGDVLIDQYAFMLRCGFDAFEIGDDEDPAAWSAAADMVKNRYQYDPVPAGGKTDDAGIPWRRHA